MGAKHTGGRWGITTKSLKPDQVPAIGISSPGHWINLAGVYKVVGVNDEEAQANARLIAAAPELLAVCSRMLNLLDTGGSDALREWSQVHRDLRVLVSRVEGTS